MARKITPRVHVRGRLRKDGKRHTVVITGEKKLTAQILVRELAKVIIRFTG